MSINQFPGLSLMEYSISYRDHKYIATTLVYRGTFVPSEISQTVILNLKRSVTYMNWSTLGLKISHSKTPSLLPARSRMQAEQLGVGLFRNNTGPGYTIKDLIQRFNSFSIKNTHSARLDFVNCLNSAKDIYGDYVELSMDGVGHDEDEY